MALQSIEPQRPVDGALRFLPAWQLFDIGDPALEVRMILERQARCALCTCIGAATAMSAIVTVSPASHLDFARRASRMPASRCQLGASFSMTASFGSVFNSGLTTYSTR